MQPIVACNEAFVKKDWTSTECSNLSVMFDDCILSVSSTISLVHNLVCLCWTGASGCASLLASLRHGETATAKADLSVIPALVI